MLDAPSRRGDHDGRGQGAPGARQESALSVTRAVPGEVVVNATDPNLLVGQTIGGKFVVESHIGGGAMGEVYRARHLGLDRVVALKVLRPDLSDDTFAARFQREAKAASSLDHPNTVRVLDFGNDAAGLSYIAMEFLDGRDLFRVLHEDWPLSSERIVDLLGQTLRGMKAAHQLGIVHRDLKPENIMVLKVLDEEGHQHEVVKVCDFGIAKVADSRGFQTSRALTTTGTLVGTPEYMSPEQARGEPLDARSDLYSVGIILFQLLTKQVPFTSESPIGVVVKQVTDAPPQPSSIRKDVDPRLAELCLKALAKSPESRFQSASEMRAALRGAADPLSSTSSPQLPGAVSAPLTSVTSGSISRSASSLASTDEFERPTVPAPETVEGQRQKRGRSLPIFLSLVLAVGLVLGGLPVILRRALGRPGPSPSVATSPPPSTPTPSASLAVIVRTAAPTPSFSSTSLTTSGKLPGRPSATPLAATPLASTARAPGHAALPPAPSAPVPPAPASVAAEPPPAPFNTEQAYIQIRGVVGHGVRNEPVSSFLTKATPSLSSCYRVALKATGAPVGGNVQLSLSIDGQGTIQAAVVVGVKGLPDLPRCFQGVLQSKSIGQNALTEPAATADAQIALMPSPP